MSDSAYLDLLVTKVEQCRFESEGVPLVYTKEWADLVREVKLVGQYKKRVLDQLKDQGRFVGEHTINPEKAVRDILKPPLPRD